MNKNLKTTLLAGATAAVLAFAAHADPRGSGRDREDDDRDDRGVITAEICFTAFEGTVYYQFSLNGRLPSNAVAFPLQGRVFGALVPCAGLGQWPVMGTVVVDGGQIVLGFRAMTVDAASCGAVDYIARLDPATLTGPLQLHNGRNDFSNQSTLTPGACARPPAPGEPGQRAPRIAADPQGNPAP
jgi:hypothetical protein